MKKLSALLVLLLTLAWAAPAFAQEPTLTLDLNRDFGYGGFEGDIEGLFSMKAEGPADLQRVDFYIDEILIASVSEAPFRVQFTTKDYAPGTHVLRAVGFTASGLELRSNTFERVFLSAEEARDKTVGLIAPILGVVAVILLITTLVPILLGRKKPEPGKYGISGGAVCPKCELPFPLHFFSPHFGAKNLERCPHCGKWVWARRASKDDLAAAEARWAGSEAPAPSERRDRLSEQIDESRYEG